MWELALTLILGSLAVGAFYVLWASHGFFHSPHPQDHHTHRRR